MRAAQAAAGPVAAGLLAATAAFAFVALVTGGESAKPEAARPAPATAAGVATWSGHAEGRAVFARMGCGSCHRLAAAGSQGEIGPDLDERLAYHTRASLTAKIVDPSQGLGEGFSVMPDDFGSRMTGGELQALVEFLLAARPGR